jgi:tRNA U38,U39,U40 pseudouridine synthase TruA
MDDIVQIIKVTNEQEQQKAFDVRLKVFVEEQVRKSVACLPDVFEDPGCCIKK